VSLYAPLLQFPRSKGGKPAPLIHTRPEFRQLSAKGGSNSWRNRHNQEPWLRALPATLRAMRRWHPDDPILSMSRDQQRAIARAMWEAGFKAGAGYKP